MAGGYTVRERYGVAVSNGTLRLRSQSSPADAIAAAGASARSSPLGLALWRAKYANDRHAYRHTQSLLMARVAHTARRRRWPESAKVLKLLAAAVMHWAVFSVCPACSGRGLRLLAGTTNVLSDDACDLCHGDGHTAIEHAVLPTLVGRAKDIAQLLTDSDLIADELMRRQLALAIHKR